jgi:hypothetical protein
MKCSAGSTKSAATQVLGSLPVAQTMDPDSIPTAGMLTCFSYHSFLGVEGPANGVTNSSSQAVARKAATSTEGSGDSAGDICAARELHNAQHAGFKPM